MKQYLSLSEKLANFTIIKKEKRKLGALFLTAWNSRKIQVKVKDEATGDARGFFVTPNVAVTFNDGEILRLSISVRVSPLLSYLDRQCEKPQAVGWRRESNPTLLFYEDISRGGVRTA